jgi:deoxycytidine triphosphate deaminase
MVSKIEEEENKEREYLKTLPCPETDDYQTHGVLLSNEIEYYVTKYQMIIGYNPQHLKPAAYELTAGRKYKLGGEDHVLSQDPKEDKITIPPFEVAIIQTAERINLPRFIIARWNIRVRYAYKGLLWLGGPQVDPGWAGYLLCPLYNLSDKDVEIPYGDPIAVMDFVKTTPYYSPNKKPEPAKDPLLNKSSLAYPRPPQRVIFENYDTSLISALYTKAKKKMEQMEKDIYAQLDNVKEKVTRYGTRLNQFMEISFTIIAVIVAALAIFVTSNQPQTIDKAIPIWLYLFAMISLGALFFSTWLLLKYQSIKHQLDNLMNSGKILKPIIIEQRNPLEPVVTGELFTLIGSLFLFTLIVIGIVCKDKLSITIPNFIFIPLSLLVLSITLGLILLNPKIQIDCPINERTIRVISYLQTICLVLSLISLIVILVLHL